MPKAITEDISRTKNYIPKVSQLPTTSSSIGRLYRQIEDRNIHEGRVVDLAYSQSDYINRLFQASILIVFMKSMNPLSLASWSTSIVKSRSKPMTLASSPSPS